MQSVSAALQSSSCEAPSQLELIGETLSFSQHGSGYGEIFARPPYQRTLDSPCIDEHTKRRLQDTHQALDPFILKQSIARKLAHIFHRIKVTSNVRQRLGENLTFGNLFLSFNAAAANPRRQALDLPPGDRQSHTILPGRDVLKRTITLGTFAAVLSMSSVANDEWRVLLAPYVWFAGANGALTPAPGISARDVDVSAIEALQDTEASFMLLFQAQKQQHGVLFDIFYSDVLHESQTDVESGVRYDAALKNTMVTTGYTYEFYSASEAMINVAVGMRYWQVDTQLTLGLDSPQRINSDNSESWVDPVVGVDAKFRLGDSPAYLSGFLVAGGANGGSDSFYDVSGHIGFALTDSLVASIGYRRFDVDYHQNTFIYDVKQEGWVFGLVWVMGAPQLGMPRLAAAD